MARARSTAAAPPDGFLYREDFLDAGTEAELLREIAELPLASFVFRGVAARRRVVHFGWGYDFDTGALVPGPPIPERLLRLRDLAAPLADRPPERFEEVLVTEYAPGATIGWHRDAPAFGSSVIGISLGAPCRMRFRRPGDEAWETWERVLEPRSAYVLSGAARSSWQHSIPPTRALRYSITYRTVRERHRPGHS